MLEHPSSLLRKYDGDYAKGNERTTFQFLRPLPIGTGLAHVIVENYMRCLGVYRDSHGPPPSLAVFWGRKLRYLTMDDYDGQLRLLSLLTFALPTTFGVYRVATTSLYYTSILIED